MPNKQNIERISQWKKVNIDRIIIEARKELDLPARLKAAVDGGAAASKQDFIIRAVLDKLDALGID